MGRNNKDFQDQVLYHGSSHPFNVGDTVVPGGRGNGVAFATPYIDHAKFYAGKKGSVFTVEPLPDDETYEEQHEWAPNNEKGKLGYMTSEKGFKVTGKA